MLVVVVQIGRPHHVLAPHPLLGATQRNEQGEEYASPPSYCTPPNTYPANDDDNYSDGGDGDSDDKMH